MTYQEEEQVRLRRQGSRRAIALAMEGRWREAVVANRSIIASFPSDVDAYNRLGRAYMELGEYSQAREAYNQAVTLDLHNAIAQKNLRRLSHLEGAIVDLEGGGHAEPQHFIEETGKAGVVNLYHLAPPEVMAIVVAGDRVNLKIDGSNLIVETGRGQYIGQVQSWHGRRLIRLMEGGNKYSAAIVSSTEDKITVIIREVYQNPSQIGQLSFLPKGLETVRPYSRDRMIRRGMENEEEVEEAPGYSIIGSGGEQRKVFLEESAENDDSDENEE
ncbi:tetratricopeptide repeat protein [Chloroflexota bacterium]